MHTTLRLHEQFDGLYDIDFRPRIEPRAYQLEGAAFLTMKKRAMITDAPGLGKTIQAAQAAVGKTLVAAPNYLVGQWGDWLETYYYRDSLSVCTGNRYVKNDAISIGARWTVVNVEMLRTHLDELLKEKYETVIFDESHHLRNRNAKQSIGAAAIAKSADRVYLLTATPIWREVDDLYMQLHIIHPDIFKSYWAFVDTYCITDASQWGTKILGVRGDKIEELEEILNIVRIGRSYEELGRAIPPLIEKLITIELPPGIRKLYDEMVSGFVAALSAEDRLMFTSYAAIMHSLREITMWPGKIEAIKNCVEEVHDDGKTIIFTWYRGTAHDIARVFDSNTTAVVTGAFDVDERRRRALDPNNKVVVATISSLGEGIDLSEARTVIFAEEHWPPGATHQALSRIRRERQFKDNTAPVVVYYVHAKDTIDETIHKVSQRRTATIKEVLSEALHL